MKKFLLFFFSAILLLSSCSNREENSESKAIVNTQLIGKGNLTGNYMTQQNTVITNTAQWNTLLNQLDNPNNVSDGFTEINVDFNQYMIIAVFDQVYNNGGHSIDIVAANETTQNIEIDVENLLQGNVTAVVTQPYHIVKVQKSTKPVTFY